MVAAAGFAAAAAMVGALADCGTRVQARLAAPTVPRSGTMRVAFVSCCQIGRQECRLLRYHRAPLLQHHLRGRSARRRCCRCVLISAARPARSLPNRTEGASRPAARSAQQAAVARACGPRPEHVDGVGRIDQSRFTNGTTRTSSMAMSACQELRRRLQAGRTSLPATLRAVTALAVRLRNVLLLSY